MGKRGRGGVQTGRRAGARFRGRGFVMSPIRPEAEGFSFEHHLRPRRPGLDSCSLTFIRRSSQ